MVHVLLKSGISVRYINCNSKDILAYYITNLFFNVDLRIITLILVYGVNGQYKDLAGRTLIYYLLRINNEVRVTT